MEFFWDTFLNSKSFYFNFIFLFSANKIMHAYAFKVFLKDKYFFLSVAFSSR